MELRSLLRKVVFAAVCLALMAVYVALCFRPYLAARVANVPDIPHLQKAIFLEPANAEYRGLLGRNLALSGVNLDEAIASYQAAVRLNPSTRGPGWILAGANPIRRNGQRSLSGSDVHGRRSGRETSRHPRFADLARQTSVKVRETATLPSSVSVDRREP